MIGLIIAGCLTDPGFDHWSPGASNLSAARSPAALVRAASHATQRNRTSAQPARSFHGLFSEPPQGAIPVYETHQMVLFASSDTYSEPSAPTATPTGRPQTSWFATTKPVMKSS